MTPIRLVAALVCGLLFGIGLALSRMADPQVVLGFLDVFGDWDPSLLGVMIGAISDHLCLLSDRPTPRPLRDRRRPATAALACHRCASCGGRVAFRHRLGIGRALPGAGPDRLALSALGAAIHRGDGRGHGDRTAPIRGLMHGSADAGLHLPVWRSPRAGTSDGPLTRLRRDFSADREFGDIRALESPPR